MEIKEIWKSDENIDGYLFSNLGRVKNLKTNNFLKPYKKDNFYCIDSRNNGNVLIHRIISKLFVDNPYNYKYIRHIDGDKSNNKYSNLQFVSSGQKVNNLDEIDGEIWKEVFINNEYEVSNKGRVRNKSNNSLLKQRSKDLGYKTVGIKLNDKQKHFFIHKLVAEAFIPNPENKSTIDHIDQNPSNNNVENLRWFTSKEQCTNRNQSCGKKPKILQFDMDDNLVHTYENVSEVCEFVKTNNLSTAKDENIKCQLSSCLNNKKKSIYGYVWKYDSEIITEKENEVWKSVGEIFPLAKNYQVSNFGRMKNGEKLLSENKEDSIYLGKETPRCHIHILVANLFIPNPENKPLVFRIDGNKLNNSVSNLKWMTQKEISDHIFKHGLSSGGKSLKVVNTETNEETVYTSIADAFRNLELDISECTFRKYITNEKSYKNLSFIKN